MLEKKFKFKEHNTTVKTEVIAGITTFMTMAYILAVNPSVLSAAGMDATAVLLATCLASFIGTICMALYANLPFALSAGMGLNAYMAYTVVGVMGYEWQVALLAVFVEGLIFIVLSLTNVREAIFDAIPLNLKKGVSVGIGIFIAFVFLKLHHPLLYIPVAIMLILDGGLGLIKVSFMRFLHINLMKNIRTPIHDHMRKNKEWSDAQVVFRFAIIQIVIGLAVIYAIL